MPTTTLALAVGSLSTATAAALIKPLSPLDTLTSGLASITRLPIGTDVSPERSAAPAPPHDLVLYEYEASPFCRKVREAMSGLDLTVDMKPCPGARAGFR